MNRYGLFGGATPRVNDFGYLFPFFQRSVKINVFDCGTVMEQSANHDSIWLMIGFVNDLLVVICIYCYLAVFDIQSSEVNAVGEGGV